MINTLMRIKTLQKDSYKVAQEHGFFSQGWSGIEHLSLIGTEVSEAIKEAFEGRWEEHDKNGKPIGEAVELADIILRVLSYAEYMGYDMERIIREKHEYNKGRPYLHRTTKCKDNENI